MIHSDKMNSALYSLHLVLVELRSMSFDGGDSREIAEVLDWAEAMPFLIANADEDRTEAFRNHLRAIAEKSPRFQRVLTAFDSDRGFHG